MKQSPDDKIQIANFKSQKHVLVILRQLTVTLTEIIFLLLTSSFLLIISCTEPTNPPDSGPDTTSHDFSWTLDTIGSNYSMLYDVAVCNENDIWAVGEIHIEGEQDLYNAVHWNGSEWTLEKIPAVTYWGSVSKGPLNCIFAFSSDDIWGFSKAGSYIHWDGSNWTSEFISERIGGIYKIWGTSSENLYFVGNNGNITHYDGQNWQRLESGTDIHFRDIWGDIDKTTGEVEIIGVATNRSLLPQGFKLVKIKNLDVLNLQMVGLPLSLTSVWFRKDKKYYLTGNGVFFTNNLDSAWSHDTDHPLLYKESVRGIDTNDIFIVGDFGLVSHFNGSTWKQYRGDELPEFYGTYGNMSFKDNFIVTVGWINNSAIVLRGKRN